MPSAAVATAARREETEVGVRGVEEVQWWKTVWDKVMEGRVRDGWWCRLFVVVGMVCVEERVGGGSFGLWTVCVG